MTANKLFFVTKYDTVLQATTYLVRAADHKEANALVDAGIYIEESAPEILDTIESVTIDTEELVNDAKGQDRQ